MKTISKKFLSALTIAAMVSTVAFTSCKDDETTPVPEEVTQNIESAYYITGVVSSVDGALADVTVTSGSESDTTDADGIYTLKLSSTATATVSFSKDGYVSIDATAIFASDASAGAVVSVSQQMTATVEAQTAKAGEETTLTFNVEENETTDIVITIPADATTEDVDVSATYYTPAATEETAEALNELAENGGTVEVTSSLAAVNLEPSGTTFETPITISIPGDYMEGVYHAKMIDGEWVKQGEATYNAATSSYEFEVSGFSQHSIAVDGEITVSSATVTSVELTTEVLNNLGFADATSETVDYELYSGWATSDSTSSLNSYVTGIMGSASGLTMIPQSIEIAVAGDEQITVYVTQQQSTTTFTVDSNSIDAVTYGAVSITTDSVQGDMRPAHN